MREFDCDVVPGNPRFFRRQNEIRHRSIEKTNFPMEPKVSPKDAIHSGTQEQYFWLIQN
jgi:hypothetical protein